MERKERQASNLASECGSWWEEKALVCVCVEGGGGEVTDPEIEELLLNWISERRGKGLLVSRKLITMKS